MCIRRIVLRYSILLGLLPVLGTGLPVLANSSGADTDAHIQQAAACFSSGNYGCSVKEYRHALSIAPMDPYAALGLAAALRAQGNLTASEMVIRSLLRQHPDFTPAYYNLGVILEAEGNLESARQAYQSFIRYSNGQLPDLPEIHIKFRELGLL